MTVPSQQPIAAPGTARLAIIGEAPALAETSWRTCTRGHEFAGEEWLKGSRMTRERCPACGCADSQATPRPFVGPSGHLLDDCLRRAGLRRDQCFVGNVFGVSMNSGELAAVLPDSLRLRAERLTYDMEKFAPNCVLLLGATALRAFHPAGNAATISNWRGSLFASDVAETPLKCIATYHPASILRSGPKAAGDAGSNPSWLPLLRLDVKKAVSEASTSTLSLPKRHFDWKNDADTLVTKILALLNRRTPIGHDIEGRPLTGIKDFSFATSPTEALWVPIKRITHAAWWPPADEQRIMDATRQVLESELVPKSVFASGSETFTWKWACNITLRGVVSDPMFSWHELMAELEKRINMAASILTKQPYWGEWDDWHTEEERAIYNCIDSCMCLELDEAIEPMLTPGQRAHRDFNLSLQPAMSWQEFHGIRFDAPARDALVTALDAEVIDLQAELDTLAGITPPTFGEVRDIVAMKVKRERCVDWSDIATHAKPSWKERV